MKRICLLCWNRIAYRQINRMYLFVVASLYISISSCSADADKLALGLGARPQAMALCESGGFGRVVILVGDIDEDGSEDLAIACDEHPIDANTTGVVHQVSSKTGRLIRDFVGPPLSKRYGYEIATIRDPATRRPLHLVVSDPYAENDIGGVGCLYVHTIGSQALRYTVKNPLGDVLFGYALSTDGDVNLDGIADIAVGGRGRRSLTGDRSNGSLTMCSGKGGEILYQVRRESEHFGDSVHFIGDVDADTASDVLVSTLPGQSDHAETGSLECISGASGASIYSIDCSPVRCISVSDVNRDIIRDVVIINAGATITCRVYSGKDGALLFEVPVTMDGMPRRFSLAAIENPGHQALPAILCGNPLDRGPSDRIKQGKVQLVDLRSGTVRDLLEGGGMYAQCGWTLSALYPESPGGTPLAAIGYMGRVEWYMLPGAQ
jgi:hypothetical protein